MQKAYEWADVQILFDGGTVPVVGTKKIAYTAERDHQNIHGKGAAPVEYIKGQKNFSGDVTLLQSAVEALQSVIPAGKDITDMVYNLTVSYAPEGGQVKTDRLEAVRFTSVPKDIGADNPYMEINMPMVIGNIKYNI